MTDAAPTALTELQHDALTELVNLGVSHAANSLREMINQQVLLSVPTFSLVSRERAIEILTARENDKLVAVHQVFRGRPDRTRDVDLPGDPQSRTGAGGDRGATFPSKISSSSSRRPWQRPAISS